jgi:hypothetical protein
MKYYKTVPGERAANRESAENKKMGEVFTMRTLLKEASIESQTSAGSVKIL